MLSNLAYKFYLIYPHVLLKMINIVFLSQMKMQSCWLEKSEGSRLPESDFYSAQVAVCGGDNRLDWTVRDHDMESRHSFLVYFCFLIRKRLVL